MHSSIFVLLRRFVESTHDHCTWVKLFGRVGVKHSTYQMQEMYPPCKIFALIGTLAEKIGQSVFDMREQFGEYIVTDLMLIYSNYIRQNGAPMRYCSTTKKPFRGSEKGRQQSKPTQAAGYQEGRKRTDH
jgi:hypothetical protein